MMGYENDRDRIGDKLMVSSSPTHRMKHSGDSVTLGASCGWRVEQSVILAQVLATQRLEVAQRHLGMASGLRPDKSTRGRGDGWFVI